MTQPALALMQASNDPVAGPERPRTLETALARARNQGADLLVTPELYLSGTVIGRSHERQRKYPTDRC